jgi:cytosine/uracil/thiamine/allantoin permease
MNLFWYGVASTLAAEFIVIILICIFGGKKK